ncbi:MAG: deoxyribonuclease IV [Planctomycetota bacterium]
MIVTQASHGYNARVLLGAHVSTAGGMSTALAQAAELGCEAIQVFTRNQRQWSPKPLDPDAAAAFRAANPYPAVSHASYLINLCATDPTTLARSKKAFVDEIERCALLGIPYVCLHPGSHVGAGEAAGLAAIAASLKAGLAATSGRKVTVLLENTAGQGTNLGHRLEHLDFLRRKVRSKRIGFCIDTCHLFAAGYDLRDYDACMDEVVTVLGADRIRAFHLNDSQHPCGSRRDRHAAIGDGEIGSDAFARLVNDARFERTPGLLETPGGFEQYPANLRRLRGMRAA